jgi:hypothetical protein
MSSDFLKVKQPYRRTSPLRRTLIVTAAVVLLLLAGDAANQKFELSSAPHLIPWPTKEVEPEIPIDIPPPLITEALIEESDISAVQEAIGDSAPAVKTEPAADTVTVPVSVMPQMKVEVFPPGLVEMKVDGLIREINEYFETTQGQHEIVIEHEDFPIYRTYASVPADTARLEFDLRDRFTGLDSTNVILVTLPRDDRYVFDLIANGKRNHFEKTRHFAFYLQNGLWHISAEMRPRDADAGGELKVDSIVVGVVGKTKTSVITGNDGLININSGPAGDQKMRLLIYWSEIAANAGR